MKCSPFERMLRASSSSTARIADEEDPSVVHSHIQLLTTDEKGRGLETHVTRLFSNHRKTAVRAVLKAQHECQEGGCDDDITSHSLRRKSCVYSKLSARYAYEIAQCDHVIALKASICRWKQPQPKLQRQESMSMPRRKLSSASIAEMMNNSAPHNAQQQMTVIAQ